MVDIRSFRRILFLSFRITPLLLGILINGCELFRPEAHEPGELVWQYQIESQYHPAATPAISSKGDIIFGTGDHRLYCLRSNGSLRWDFEAGFEFQYRHAAAIGEDGTIYAASRDAYLYAFNPNGTIKWKYLLGNLPFSGPGIGVSGSIYVCVRDGTVRAICPDGTEKWRYSIGAVYSASTPVMDKEETIYCGSSDGSVYAIRRNGSLKWRRQTESEWFWNASFHDHDLYITSGDRVLYVFSDDGYLRWTFENEIHWRGVTTGASIDEHGIIYVGTRDSYVVALNSSGRVIWRTRLGTSDYKDEILTTPLLGNDGSIYVCTGSGWLHVLNQDGSPQWNWQIATGTSSILAMGRTGILYVSDYDGLISALHTCSSALARSPWPKERGDYRNSGQR